MSKAAAQDTINHNAKTIALRYWGDDTNDDDLLFGPVSPTTLFAAEDGLHFERAATLPHLQLDEDSGTFENIGDSGLDGIYVGARFSRPQRQHDLQGGKQPHHRRFTITSVRLRCAPQRVEYVDSVLLPGLAHRVGALEPHPRRLSGGDRCRGQHGHGR
jgi:hypothetical protein